MRDSLPGRRWFLRGLLGVALCALALAAVTSAVTDDPTGLGPGNVSQPANGDTVVSVQGFHFRGVGNGKKPARLVSAGPNATTQWVHDGGADSRWYYDVDPLSDGNLLVTSTEPGETVVYEYDPRTRERVWTERFDIEDTHDVDLIGDDELLVANMRATNDSGTPNDRVFVYNRTQNRVVWEWVVRNHFPRGTDGGYSADWTHVNDVDEVGEGKYLVSLRNFDQAVVVDRSTKRVELRLGRDGAHATLDEQHNPDSLESETGTPTILVADSENDRVVEYERTGGPAGNGTWERTWALTGFDWPRDADRLPNGNTLVTDTLNQRVVEVTPRGEIVWEYFAPWAPYDAERLSAANTTGGENASVGGSNGPTIADLGASGRYAVSGGTNASDANPSFPTWISKVARDTPVETEVDSLARSYAHVTPFVRPVWLSSWGFAAALGGVALGLCWAVGEVVYRRGRIRRELARRLP
ncbi:aryl-sulfate sulfotransferase [Halococcus salsus]|uniref:aryl-sulfate sulfotransferase n=1 Tax=Halococcus salsus TaxID=2162894 RepID=UPI0013585995|nr:aryl-sulfate sulfotransferase [Halococcus salsus]